MKGAAWFRAAAVFFVLFAVGHTYGFMQFKGTTPESMAVRASMDAVRFHTDSADRGTIASFGNFYVGFGLFVTLYFLFSAWLALRLAAMTKRESARTDIAALGWPMVALMVINTVMAVKWFGGPPVVLSTIIAACLCVGTLRARQMA